MYIDEKKIGETHLPQTQNGKWLWEAADYIEKHGWCQNALNDGEAKCALGAIFHVADEEYYRPTILLADYIFPRFGHTSVPCWNDAHGRTKEQVIQTLRNAAMEAK